MLLCGTVTFDETIMYAALAGGIKLITRDININTKLLGITHVGFVTPQYLISFVCKAKNFWQKNGVFFVLFKVLFLPEIDKKHLSYDIFVAIIAGKARKANNTWTSSVYVGVSVRNIVS